jgi:hypothetical protein
MAIKTSGPLSIGEIAFEFGGTVPHSMSEYYRGGALVPDATPNIRIPVSQRISISDFYGSTRFFTTVVPGDGIAALSTDTFAQTCIAQNDSSDSQPAVIGSYQKYYFRTFQGFNVSAVGTQITIPNTSVTIRGDLAGGKSGDNQQTGIRNPGIEIVYRSSRFAPAVVVGSFRGVGASEDDASGTPTIFVPGGTTTCNAAGFYMIRRVADVFSTFISTAPVNIFSSAAFPVSTVGVASYVFLPQPGSG